MADFLSCPGFVVCNELFFQREQSESKTFGDSHSVHAEDNAHQITFTSPTTLFTSKIVISDHTALRAGEGEGMRGKERDGGR